MNLGSYRYSSRRMIYGYIDSLNVPEFYNQFDFANPEITMGKRYETIVPQQSLLLMNSPLVVEQARNSVDRPDFKSLTNDEDRVTLLYEPRIAKMFHRPVTLTVAVFPEGSMLLTVTLNWPARSTQL